MTIQSLPNDVLSYLFQWFSINDLEKANDVCKTWKNCSNTYLQKELDLLSQEIDTYVNEAFIVNEREIVHTLQINQKYIIHCKNKRLGPEEENILRIAETNLKQLSDSFQRYKERSTAEIEQKNRLSSYKNHFHFYQFLLRKKVTLLIELMNVSTFVSQARESSDAFIKVSDLKLTDSKAFIKNLVKNKLKEFLFFTKNEMNSIDFTEFKKFSNLYELMPIEDLDKTGAKKWLDNRFKVLKKFTTLNELKSHLMPIKGKFLILKIQPDEIQYKGKLITPFPLIMMDSKLACGNNLRAYLIDETDVSIENSLESIHNLVITDNDRISFDNLKINEKAIFDAQKRYSILFHVGSFSIKSNPFQVL